MFRVLDHGDDEEMLTVRWNQSRHFTAAGAVCIASAGLNSLGHAKATLDADNADSRNVDVARPVEAQRQRAGDGGDVAQAGDGLHRIVGTHHHGREHAVEDQPQGRESQHRRRLRRTQRAMSA